MENTSILLDNINFIYELLIVQLELESLKIDFKIKNDLRSFNILNSNDIDKLIKRTACFKTVNGNPTNYYRIIQKNTTKSINQYLTHWIYPYKGKFHPQMIRAMLNIIGLNDGDTVLDPFSGSGTTALESQLLGINCIGIDISPLCILQGNVKTKSISYIKEIEEIKEDILNKININIFNIDDKPFLDSIEFISNENVKNFYKMAYFVSLSDNVRRKKDLRDSFYKNVDLMIKSIKDYNDIKNELGLKLGNTTFINGDSRNLPLDNESVDGIITSPPYSIALDYISNDIHSLEKIGCDIQEIENNFIGTRGSNKEKINIYNQDMENCYKEMYRVLKPNKYVVIVIGNATYKGEEIKSTEYTIDCCQKIGFKLIKNIDKVIFGIYNVMQKENILIFQKNS